MAVARPGSHLEQPEAMRFECLTSPDQQPWDAETLELTLQQATTCLGGLGAAVHRRDPAVGRLRLVTVGRLFPDGTEAWADLADAANAAARAVQSGAYAWVPGDRSGHRESGAVAVPLLAGDKPIGALSVLTAGPAEPDELRRSFLHAIAAWGAERLERVPGRPSAGEAAFDRTVRIVELTAALADAVTSQDVLRAVAEHVLPPFGADGLGIYAFEKDRLHLVGHIGYPKAYRGLWSQIRGLPLTSHPIIADVIRTRTPLFIESKAEILRRYPEMAGFTATSPKNTWAFLPLIASGRAIGCCDVSFSRERPIGEEERTLLTALSGLVAQAFERARLYDAEHARAEGLQCGLLPRKLPCLPAVRAAARYLPAGRGDAVGGDWYDLIQLSADRVAMVIGDVMGHGISEAATMGRLRTAVRTLADLEMPPDELLGRLNDLVSDLGEDFYATCLYAVFDPVSRSCTLSSAGHPPPVIVHPDGSVHIPDLVPDPPLGAAEPPFATHDLQMPAQGLVVLFTDGLVESATRDIDDGVAMLRHVLAHSATVPHLVAEEMDADTDRLERLCDSVTSALMPDREQAEDDAALLMVHTHNAAARDVAVHDLPFDPRAAGQARAYVREQLTVWGLGDLVMPTELVVSELVGNAIRHAKGPVRLRLLRSRSMICEVYDGSLTTPRIRHATYTDEGGRGLQLVAACSQHWGARYLHDGKCIWVEQDIPR